MAQEDKGLVIRGLVLLGFIGVLVVGVVTMLFWHADPPTQALERAPEYSAAAVVLPATLAGYPSGVSWYALIELSENSPSMPGWDIRYNAATTLARLGSASVPWPILREMLDEKQQMRNYRVRQPDGKEVIDEAAARMNMLGALKAIAVWHDKKKGEANHEVPADLRAIYAQVDKLTESRYAELKNQAEKARSTFFR